MTFKLDKNFDIFEKKLQEIKTTAPNKLSAFMKLQGEDLKRNIKEFTPKDTGTLRNGWHRRTIGKLTQIIYNDVEYALHVNYGHRVGKNNFKVKRGAYMLQKGLIKRKKIMYIDLQKAFREVFK